RELDLAEAVVGDRTHDATASHRPVLVDLFDLLILLEARQEGVALRRDPHRQAARRFADFDGFSVEGDALDLADRPEPFAHEIVRDHAYRTRSDLRLDA